MRTDSIKYTAPERREHLIESDVNPQLGPIHDIGFVQLTNMRIVLNRASGVRSPIINT